ncbi:MAG: PSD1 and planctomycete cytochrome C domain-containing protein [Cytophagales bacterium]|nr:PSD1 and planctomycete cytochrome C domain-containing protein [Cytophagales bacterium]
MVFTRSVISKGLFFLITCAFTGAFIYACRTNQSIESISIDEDAIPVIVDFNFHVKPILSDRCFKCHGPDPNTREGGLALHTAEFAFGALGKDHDRFALKPGQPDSSTLIQRIFTENPDDIMPPPESNLTLTAREKEILKKWVAQGAEWKKHWAFTKPVDPLVPEADQTDWGNNEIDRFTAEKMIERGFKPSKRESPEKLLRRVTFDLTGLPPTQEELSSFLADESEDAFEKRVDALLASSAYGERMAVDWMDVSRYADSHGYQDDFERIAWPWRDWVIHAFNKNLPYDEFVSWQLAGDLMPNPTMEMIVATSFNRNHKITAEGGVIPEEYRTEYVADRSQTVGTAFLGLTMECSRCHDHKYDPITQKDYFSLFAFFNNIPEVGLINMNQLAAEPKIEISQKDIDEVLTFINNRTEASSIPLMVMKEMDQPRKTHILNRGVYDQPTDEVLPDTPPAILGYKDEFQRDRLGLAKWLFDEDNPLTARVAVNRLWLQVFGKGIVSTANDFGNQGALPTHPALLDYLALKYQREGWNTKAMLKYIVMSETYQQSNKVTEELQQRDPENLYLARAPRLRLTAEMIRDQALAVSGLLNNEIGGPSVKPYQPEGLWKETTGGGGGSLASYQLDTGNQIYRRGLYTFWKRTMPPPSMMTFDAASRDMCIVQRQQTSTPLQALVLLNDPQVIEASRALAQQSLDMGLNKTDQIIEHMFRKVTSRSPSVEEIGLLEAYFKEEQSRYSEDEELVKDFLEIGRYKVPELSADLAAYALVANAIFNLDESVIRG